MSFRPGQRVRIGDAAPGVHHRVPAYAKGRTGIVERVCGRHGRPEQFIRGNGEPLTRIYRVVLDPGDLWQEGPEQPGDRVELEVFEHWLESAP